ncbi:MAG: hypothetical protein M1292_12835 [Bacteroidetes bacterium]|nr:hypothetical protein [Bacteroidota bacterium]
MIQKLLVIVFALISLQGFGHKLPKKEIQPYIQFLDSVKISAKDYILSLWETHDIVIYCERYHGEFTQYNLLLEVINDDRFIKEVGAIFTEVGTVSLQKELNTFLQTRYSTDKVRNNDLLNLYRNLTFTPIWEKYNFFHFLQEINKLNSKITDSLSVKLYPLSFEFPGWKNITTTEEYKNWFYKQPNFDSIMASNFKEQYNKRLLEGSRKKCLVILNYRHAFKFDVSNQMGEKTINIPNTGRLIFDTYKDKVANVLVNSWALLPVNNPDTDSPEIPIQLGKWDASFKFLNIKSIGFNFKNSPFGNDHFDLWQYSKHNFKYGDMFTGFVFYLPLEEHYEVFGIPNIVSKEFKTELRRRLELFNPVWNWNAQGVKSEIDETIKETAKLKKEKYSKIREKQRTIDRWL